jgi:hypothetical protein
MPIQAFYYRDIKTKEITQDYYFEEANKNHLSRNSNLINVDKCFFKDKDDNIVTMFLTLDELAAIDKKLFVKVDNPNYDKRPNTDGLIRSFNVSNKIPDGFKDVLKKISSDNHGAMINTWGR